jgi:PAS domain S-box-containing protein
VVFGGFWALAYFGVYWTREEERTSAIWLANAFALGVMLRTRQRLHPYLLMACFAANLSVYTQAGDPLERAVIVALVNIAEIFVMAKAVSRYCGSLVRFDDLWTLQRFTGIAAAVALLSGAPVTFLLAGGTGAAALEIWGNWLAAHALGLLIAAPLVVIAIDSWQSWRKPDGKKLWEWLLILAAVLAVSLGIFAQSRFPLLFLACPLVILAAFRTGVVGTAASVAIISTVAIIATLADSGPISLVQGELGLSLLTLQLFLAINFVIGLPVAAVLEERNSIRDRLADTVALSQTITDNLREVIFRTDPQGRWIFLNPAWEKLTGHPVAYWIGKTSYRLIVRDDFPSAQAEFAKLASGEIKEALLRQRFRHADGSTRQIEVSIRRLTDGSGTFTGAIGNIRDITEAVAQQDALAASEDRFRRIAESAPVGVFRANHVGELTYINAAWANKTGMTAKEMLGNGWLRAIADLSPFMENPAWADFAPGEVRRRTVRFRTVGDNELWMEIVTSAEFDSSGELQGFVGVAIDITEQKHAYEELAKRDAELSLLASNATDAVFRLSLDGMCKYASPSAHKLLGLPANSLLGANLISRFHPDEREEVEASFAALRSGEIDQKLIAYRSERVTAPGEYIWLEANCGLLRDVEGAPMEIIASIRNISARKALEEALKVARNRAEAAVRARSAFLANMSHEIRTPMNGVIGFTEVLLAGQLSSEQRRQIEMIADSGRAMLRLLNDILDMSKIEAGQMTLAPEAVDVRHIMNGVTRMLQPAAQSKNLEVTISVTDDLPEYVRTDPLRLRQILLNLASNAIKFTERGYVKINAGVDAGEKNPLMTITVEDSGIGMAADRLEAIFAPFTQAEDDTAHRFGGTGLGLSISQELARLMDGHITVVSTEGEGTTFTLSLPLEIAERTAPRINEVALAADSELLPHVRLLVAEDNDINQQLMRDMAAKTGIDIEIANDGESAIEMVRKAARSRRPYAMILMDLRMPGMGGLEAARRLREIGYSADELPIIALTANAFQDDIKACLEAGMQGHLAKPLRLNEFREAVRHFASPIADTRDASPIETSSSSAPDDLKQRYLARKSDVFTLIATLAGTADFDSAKVKELTEMLHKLAGTAGAFGEEKLGEAAATLEQALRSAGPGQVAAVLANAEPLVSITD